MTTALATALASAPAAASASSAGPAAAAPERSVGVSSLAREYLSFKLGSEEYGIDILRVQEIRGYEAPTASPTCRRSSRAWSTCVA